MKASEIIGTRFYLKKTEICHTVQKTVSGIFDEDCNVSLTAKRRATFEKDFCTNEFLCSKTMRNIGALGRKKALMGNRVHYLEILGWNNLKSWKTNEQN